MNNLEKSPGSAPMRDGKAMAELEMTDSVIRSMALELGAMEFSYSTLIAAEVLWAAEYQRAFPHLLMGATTACNPAAEPDRLFQAANLEAPAWFLSPAVCYHTYAQFAEKNLEHPVLVTARGKCFRNEDREVVPGRRQIEFEMREIVLLGPAAWIQDCLADLQKVVENIAVQFDLAGEWAVAEDPFFLPCAKGKALMQRLQETKKEFCLKDSDQLAIASINRHGSFFGERFNISNPDGSPVHTACIAFGLDRCLSSRLQPQLQSHI